MFSEEYRRDMDQAVLTTQEKEAILQALGEEKPMRTEKFTFKAVLIAAALCVAMIVSALAVELTVGWESFLGRTPQKAVTTVGESAVTGDYTLTLQEAIVDDDGAAFLLALTRNDGGVIEGDPRLSGNILHWDVKVDEKNPNMTMDGDRLPIRSEDGKTVYYCMEFDKWDQEGESLLGKTITFQCRGVSDLAWTEDELAMTRETVSLAPLAQTARQVDMTYDDISQGKNKPELMALVEELSAQAIVPLTRLGEGKTRVSAVLFTEDGPVVAVDGYKGLVRQENFLTSNAISVALTDTRTGECWAYQSGTRVYQREEDDGGFYLSCFTDCPLTAEDLPYVEVTVRYTMEKVLSDEPVELSFSANVGRQMTKMLDQDIDFFYYGDCSAHLTQARTSALRLRLSVDRMDRKEWLSGPERETAPANTLWTLVQKDGSQSSLRVSPNHFDEELGTGWIDLEAQNEDGERQLIDPDQVEALMVGETVIPLK